MIQYVYVCKDGLPVYVFMYLFLQTFHHGLWCKKKNLWMSLEFFFYYYFFFTLRQYCYLLLL